MFAYCNNNPINYGDQEGYIPFRTTNVMMADNGSCTILSNKVMSIANKEKYSKEKWDNSTIAQKKQLLEDELSEVALAMNIPVSRKINYYSKEIKGTISYGSFLAETNAIYINEAVLENDAYSYHLLTTIRHEARHCYQHKAKNILDKQGCFSIC